jgi:hypothetical protein
MIILIELFHEQRFRWDQHVAGVAPQGGDRVLIGLANISHSIVGSGQLISYRQRFSLVYDTRSAQHFMDDRLLSSLSRCVTDFVSPYQPLEDGSIRLLSFLDDTGYACEVKPFILRSAPRYITLSYTWDAASYQKGRKAGLDYSIILNERCFAVQQNLYDALGHLGRKVRSHNCYFWVNAICINRGDLAERASQVRQMTTIYEKSHRIFAWLGVPFSKAETKLAIHMMHDLHIYLRDGLEKSNDDIASVLATVDSKHSCFPREPGSPVWTAWDGIAGMFNQPYFHRVWIYQEATTPRPIDFHCGIFKFDETLFSAAVSFGMTFSEYQGFDDRFVEATSIGSNVGLIGHARSTREKGTETSLIELMEQLRQADCTNAMDRVFATLGLAQDLPVGRISVDYMKSVDQLFVDVARYLIADSGLGLGALRSVYTPTPFTARRYLSETFHPRVPSWVPDWRQRGILEFPSSLYLTADGKPLCNAWPGTEVQAQFSDREIELVGCVAENLQIQTMTHICDRSGTPGTFWDTARAWHHTLLTDPNASDGIEKAIDRTLVGDTSAVQGTKDDVSKWTFQRGVMVDWTLVNLPREDLDLISLAKVHSMHMVMVSMCFGRRRASLTDGSVGIVPAATALTNKIAAFHGGRSLYVIRPLPHTPDTYNFVGECYVDGYMDGELFGASRQCKEPVHMQSLKLM